MVVSIEVEIDITPLVNDPICLISRARTRLGMVIRLGLGITFQIHYMAQVCLISVDLNVHHMSRCNTIRLIALQLVNLCHVRKLLKLRSPRLGSDHAL